MDKQTTRVSNAVVDRPTKPSWWTEKHSSTWDHVRDALRRDWEQTRSDFSSNDRGDLNQNLTDTVKQAFGSVGVPPPDVKTRPDDPEEAAKRAERDIRARGKAQERVDAAHTDVAAAEVRAQGKIASEQQAAQAKVADAQRKLGDLAANAREDAAKGKGTSGTAAKVAEQAQKVVEARTEGSQKVAAVRQEVGEKIAERQRKVGEATAVVRDWARFEPAVRYGYVARLQYPDRLEWDDTLDDQLRHEWTQMKSDGSWEDMRPHVRHGWDAAARNSIV